MRLIVIGNGMAATRLIASLTERAPGRFTITVFGVESEHAYYRSMLSPVLGGEKQAQQIRLQDDAWYHARGVTVRRGEKVLSVDVEKREVRTTAATLAWDELVFATGSTPFVPPIPGGDAPHVFTFRTLADIRAIQENPGRAVVLGGGVLGVEVAAALARSCDNVTLVHRGAWLMEQQLDRQAGVLLEEALAERGVRCELSSGVTAIAADAVTLHNGRKINASRVVLATGVHWQKPAAFTVPAALWLTTRCRPQSRRSAPSVSAAKSTARRSAWSHLAWRRRISSPPGWLGRLARHLP